MRATVEWDSVGLGTRSDVQIAREYGVAHQTVGKARRRRGIPTFGNGNGSEPVTIDWDTVGLGQRPDSVVAREVGVPRRMVCGVRIRRQIPAFIGLILDQEGMPCRSILEAMYDATLHEANRSHEREAKVPNLPYTADFAVGTDFVEIAGMLPYARYKVKYETKRRAYEDHGVPVTWFTGEEVERLYSTCTVPLRFRERFCDRCKKLEHDLVKGVCRPCRLIEWRGETPEQPCVQCGEPFRPARGSTERFCGYRCYWDSLTMAVPTKGALYTRAYRARQKEKQAA